MAPDAEYSCKSWSSRAPLTPQARWRQIRWVLILGCRMNIRPILVWLLLLVALVSAPFSQTHTAEVLWQFEAGG